MNGHLSITAKYHQHNTCLSSCFFSPPFKVARINTGDSRKQLHLMIMSASPGILDNDHHKIEIHLLDHAALHLQTQSYQRLFTMTSGATQSTTVFAGSHSFFCYLPHPTVPHKGAIFSAINTFSLSGSSTFIWGEILTPGRMNENEVFLYTTLVNCTSFYIDNRLLLKENLHIQPAMPHWKELGSMEGYTHYGALFIWNGNRGIESIRKYAHDLANLEKDATIGTTILEKNGMVIRMLGKKAESMHRFFQKIADKVQAHHQTSATITLTQIPTA